MLPIQEIVSNGEQYYSLQRTESYGSGTITSNLEVTMVPKDKYNSNVDAFTLMYGQRSNILSTVEDGMSDVDDITNIIEVRYADYYGNERALNIHYGDTYADFKQNIKDLDVEYYAFNYFTDEDSNKVEDSTRFTSPVSLSVVYKPKYLLPGPEFNITLKKCISDNTFTDNKVVFSNTFGSYDDILPMLQGLDWKLYDVSAAQDMSSFIYRSELEGQKVAIVSKYGNIIFNQDSSEMFSGISNLVSFSQVGSSYKFDTSLVTDMSRMFLQVPAMTKCDVADFDTSNVTTMSQMFDRCIALVDLDISKFDLSNCINIDWMFQNCESITSINVSSWDVSNVLTAIATFHKMYKLRSLDVSNWKMAQVKVCASMFDNLSLVTSLDLQGFDTSNVTNSASMFKNCPLLTTIGDVKLTFNKSKNMDSMFSGDKELIKLDTSEFGMSECVYGQNLFRDCYKLTSIATAKWRTSKIQNFSLMFYGCKALTSLYLKSFNTSSATTFQSMFANCPQLISIDCSSFNTVNVVNMDSMFLECRKLTSVNVSSFNTSNVTAMNHMFCNITATIIDVRNFDTRKVTNFMSMFDAINGQDITRTIKYGSLFLPTSGTNFNYMYDNNLGNSFRPNWSAYGTWNGGTFVKK